MKTLLLLLMINVSAFGQYNYPPTKTVDSSETHFGVTYYDPYQWLENMKDPEVESWFKQQADFSNSILNNISGRDELIAEWKMLDGLKPPVINSRDYYNGRLFYRKTMPGEKVSKLYFREGIYGKEQLLFDPLTYIPGKTLTIESSIPSYDGKKILVSYSEGGAEVSTIIIMDVDTKTILPDALPPSRFGAISWTFDNNAFTYSAQKTEDKSSEAFLLSTKTKLHRLGDDSKNDIDFFSDESYPDLGIKPNDLPFAWVSEYSNDHMFAGLYNVRSEFHTFIAPISQLNSPKAEWKVLCTPEDKLVRGMEIIGNDVYAITYKDAKNFKLIHTTLSNPDWANAETIAPEKPDQTLESFTFCKDYLILSYSDGINSQNYKYEFATKIISEIKFPYSGNTTIFCFDKKTNNCIAGITSWNKPYIEYELNMETNEFSPSRFNDPVVYPEAYTDLEVEEVEVKGHDGVMIPLSIIYKKGLKLDGKNVCLMDSYGAYGISMSPYFNYMENSLAVKGVVIAIPHVRGGSEKGEDWYKAGYKTTKPNTWKDFISCAEYLIEKGYTSSDRLAGTGTSAGGILISRAITERPDLFSAIICNVGTPNAMRMEFSPNGPGNIPEFGTVTDSIECLALYEMDGVQHTVKDTKYPAVLCVGGWNDPRVMVWQPGKFAAAMQNSSDSGKPVLMKVNYDNGHFTEDKAVTFANFADQFAFVMWQCGHPDFQPAQ